MDMKNLPDIGTRQVRRFPNRLYAVSHGVPERAKGALSSSAGQIEHNDLPR
jgi:hypothetical protein